MKPEDDMDDLCLPPQNRALIVYMIYKIFFIYLEVKIKKEYCELSIKVGSNLCKKE